ncbi:MAG: hypothetical protein JWN11_1382 [Hyphomicrobiales bacterium]|nr:hypothetical protein [Hyphomicrobiales bacterium]
MSDHPSTFLDELTRAARGCVALLVGDKRAAGYFDFSQRGLAGSFIAFLLATAFSAYLPDLLHAPNGGLPTWKALLVAALLFALQIGFSALALRQIKRLDGLVPYLVADNWSSFFISIGSSLLAAFGFGGDFGIIIVGLLVLVLEINIARIIVTLSPWQIAMFLVARVVGVSIGLVIFGMFFPIFSAAAGTPAG